ncbi:hypothetical protein KP509_25G030400 [Ceratopteris richardii]|uniref:non-specific serine/threonine protein kinase n=1 Tax=Ceratopteris richardii TaxID=49495 RepID=A0A8T2RP18_CERRI|nr:hypothetical protein KP509_25G030400 [Ceratopteris richardii]KAH7298172.1 hypothetical protein KP509_25G030400 [Ceratopteris richardii]
MGPFGRFTNKLKVQKEEKYSKHGSASKGGITEQCQVLSGTGAKVEDERNSPVRDQQMSANSNRTDEKTVQAVIRDQEFGSQVVQTGKNRIHSNTRNNDICTDSEQQRVGDAKSKKIWEGIHSLNAQTSLNACDGVCSLKTGTQSRMQEEPTNSHVVPIVLCKTEVIHESSDLDSSSLSLSLGLNRIKTRSGQLYSDEKDAECQKHVQDNKSINDSVIVTADGKNGETTYQKSLSASILAAENERNHSEAPAGMWEDEYGNRNSQGKFRRKLKADSQRSMRGSSVKKSSVIPTFSRVFNSNNNGASTGSERIFGFFSRQGPSKSDHLLEKNVPSTLVSYLSNEIEESADMEVSIKQLDVIKEGESPTFSQPVPSLTQTRASKKWPKDIKSFSHELGPRGGRPHDVHRPHSDNDLEEILAALRARFNTAKEEVDAELKLFAADLVEILDRNTDSFPGWKENVEDLLVLAQRCTKLSAIDFRRECENIVHGLDEQRQELPQGLLKQLYTRMLFILTRCTRLLQFQKETSPEEEGLHRVRQCLKGVPSVERTLPSVSSKRGKGTAVSKKLLPEVLEQSARNDAGLPKLKGTRKHKLSVDKANLKHQRSSSPKISQYDPNRLVNLRKASYTCESSEMKDLKKGSVKESEENIAAHIQGSWDHVGDRLLDVDPQQMVSPSRDSQKDGWSHWLDGEEVPELVICRICEEEVRTSRLEPHSLRCSWADACDCQGSNVDERLRMLADYLEKIAELSTSRSNQIGIDESPEVFKPAKLNPLDGSDKASLEPYDFSAKVVDSRVDETCGGDAVSMEDSKGISLINFKRFLGVKADQGVTSSSAGSGTPRSAINTPRTSQLDLLWAERNSFMEQEDTSQVYKLAAIAREVAGRTFMEDGVIDSLGASLEELHEFLEHNKIADLTVDTFGKRIEKLLREKIYLFNSSCDVRKPDSLSGSYDDDGMSTDDGVQSFRSTPTHSSHGDRITIEDFDILKLISRGAFGRVFLARKRSTGDYFAIKVLRKIDMIRKNAVENILAERDILISVRNPFVVRFFYSFTCRDNLYLVMEYLVGGDLYSLLRKLGCLEEHVARVYIAELVLALEYLHSLGVVHRDLKPDNILIAHDGHIKLTDFGLSKVGLINSTDDLSGPTNGAVLHEENMFENYPTHEMQKEERKERSAVGTPDYLAPEILLGTEHGYTADWWSVGIILFELLTGLPPFNAEHPQIIFDNILNRNVHWPSIPEDMSEEAKNLIDRLLTPDPNQRLGAKGAGEVKNHAFFKDISWDNLARQKAAFVPNPESVDDTSYFTSRHPEVSVNSSPRFADSSDCPSASSSSNSLKVVLNEGEDDFGDLEEFQRSPSVERTFNNFSFKNATQLAYMNYDILSQSGKDLAKGHSRHQSAS